MHKCIAISVVLLTRAVQWLGGRIYLYARECDGSLVFRVAAGEQVGDEANRNKAQKKTL